MRGHEFSKEQGYHDALKHHTEAIKNYPKDPRVRGLEFNAITRIYLPLVLVMGTGSATQGEISFISWNRKVEQILASTSYNVSVVELDDVILEKSAIGSSVDHMSCFGDVAGLLQETGEIKNTLDAATKGN
ncbi:hypothetical protein Bca52824_011295 [Brassica carinata]|uniref:Uncharacterized protein n=1 Tax=Brassica carinata TaxID=52824 RepID=A0A8X8BBI7_BRACI|nr:hypothetical protein Bca52824_011295 [Brassica carinata]